MTATFFRRSIIGTSMQTCCILGEYGYKPVAGR